MYVTLYVWVNEKLVKTGDYHNYRLGDVSRRDRSRSLVKLLVKFMSIDNEISRET